MRRSRDEIHGPWDDEPDHEEWEHVGFRCAIQRCGEVGHLCGYVGVPPEHTWHGAGYDDTNARVHGGVTWATDHAPCVDDGGHWWLGFDCGHCSDLTPSALMYRDRIGDEQYRSIDYVRDETNSLAKQARAAQEHARRATCGAELNCRR